jgi:hypothetical protein
MGGFHSTAMRQGNRLILGIGGTFIQEHKGKNGFER